MYRQRTIGVVVPAYNEERLVGEVIETMPEYVDRIYVVDDASTDGTWAEIQEHATAVNERAEERALVDSSDDAENGGERVHAIRHETNQGVGGAIKNGYRRSLEDGNDITAVMNGDGQMDPDHLYEILDPIVEGHAEYSKANRLVHDGYRDGMSSWRLFGNTVLTFLTKVSSGYWKMMDSQNGYTAISKRVLERVDIDGLHDDYGFLNDLLVTLNVHNVRIADVPVPAVYGNETSHIRYKRFIPVVSLLLLRDFLWRLHAKYLVLDFNPLVLLYLGGCLGFLVGVLGGGWSISKALVHGAPLFVPLSVSVTISMLGSLFVLFAMVFDMQANRDLEYRTYDEF